MLCWPASFAEAPISTAYCCGIWSQSRDELEDVWLSEGREHWPAGASLGKVGIRSEAQDWLAPHVGTDSSPICSTSDQLPENVEDGSGPWTPVSLCRESRLELLAPGFRLDQLWLVGQLGIESADKQ